MQTPIRIVLVEDDPQQAEWLVKDVINPALPGGRTMAMRRRPHSRRIQRLSAMPAASSVPRESFV